VLEVPEEGVSVTEVAASTGGAADGARSLRRYAEDGLGGLVGPAFGRRSASIRCPRWWRRGSWRCGWRWASCPRWPRRRRRREDCRRSGGSGATGLVADGQDGPVFLAGGAEVKVADGIDDHSGSQVRHSGAAGHGGPVAAPV
jgi:hypothetical protein